MNLEHKISMIAAMGTRTRAIGIKNGLIWDLPEDRQRFREITKGHSCIMGRKTFDSIVSILGKPLPHRTNIVVTRDKVWSAEGAVAVESIEEGIHFAKLKPGNDEIFIIGGGQIYALGLPYADTLYLTLIDDDKEGDSFFPEYEQAFTKKKFEESKEYQGMKYTWVDLERP